MLDECPSLVSWPDDRDVVTDALKPAHSLSALCLELLKFWSVKLRSALKRAFKSPLLQTWRCIAPKRARPEQYPHASPLHCIAAEADSELLKEHDELTFLARAAQSLDGVLLAAL